MLRSALLHNVPIQKQKFPGLRRRIPALWVKNAKRPLLGSFTTLAHETTVCPANLAIIRGSLTLLWILLKRGVVWREEEKRSRWGQGICCRTVAPFGYHGNRTLCNRDVLTVHNVHSENRQDRSTAMIFGW